MVKSIIYTLVAAALCLAFFLFSETYVNTQFEDFHRAVTALYDKVENESANDGDVKAVCCMWEEKKSRLHIFIPHNDISQIDYYLSEAGGFIREGRYEHALAKLEAVSHMAQSLPSSYSINLENVF